MCKGARARLFVVCLLVGLVGLFGRTQVPGFGSVCFLARWRRSKFVVFHLFDSRFARLGLCTQVVEAIV